MVLEGTSLGRYHIVRLLGSGGMGEVYLAEDPRIGQQVALKVVRSALTPYPNAQSAQEAARLFQREARALGKLDHPQVLPLHDYGEAQVGDMTLVYLVMPYRPEGSLVHWIRQHYPSQLTPPPVVAHVVSQAASALQHAHHRQITHQDVKPANFLIRTNEKTPAFPDVLLADFGIARISTSTASSSQNLRGTPTYMAPEQTLGEAVPASDQYALAVMAYELLTGQPPFQGNAVRLMYQHLHTIPEPPSAHHPSISKALDDVILTALSKQPEERFVSVTAFADALTSAIQGMEVAEAPTRISAAPMPSMTTSLPDTPQISTTLANAATHIRPPAEGTTPSSVGWMHEDAPTPVAQGWAASSTGPTGQPLAETVDLGMKKVSNAFAPSSPQGWREETGAPTTPPLPDTLSLGGAARDKEMAAPSLLPVARRRSSKRRFILIAAAVLVMLALVGGGGAYVILGASATVTITPSSKDVSNTYPITAVTGTPDASKQQVGARLLSVTPPAQTKTVNATGQENIQGAYASGTVEVDNYQGLSPLLRHASRLRHRRPTRRTLAVSAWAVLRYYVCVGSADVAGLRGAWWVRCGRTRLR